MNMTRNGKIGLLPKAVPRTGQPPVVPSKRDTHRDGAPIGSPESRDGPKGKGFWLHSIMGRHGDALRLVLADTAALRKFIRVNPG